VLGSVSMGWGGLAMRKDLLRALPAGSLAIEQAR
jgi:hypothetical protein